MRIELKNVNSCSFCESSETSHAISVVVIALRLAGKWIMVKTPNQEGWGLPYGPVPEDSSPVSAAKREIYNKTGVISGAIYPVCTFSFFEHGRFGSKNPIYGRLFFAEAEHRAALPFRSSSQVILRSSADDCLSLPLYNKYLISLLLKKAQLYAEKGDAAGFNSGSAYLFDKVCGAVVYCGSGDSRKYVLIQNLSGHVGFPKGHVEAGETEYFTALRETAEETGLHPVIDEGLRKVFSYMAWEKPGRVHKTAVYFPAEATEDEVAHIVPQKEEILSYWVVPFDEARKLLDKESDRKVLEATENYLNSRTLSTDSDYYQHIFDDIRHFLKENAASSTKSDINALPDPMILVKIHQDQSFLYTNYACVLKISPSLLICGPKKPPFLLRVSDDFINVSFTEAQYAGRIRRILHHSDRSSLGIPLPDDSERGYYAGVLEEILKSRPGNSARGISADLMNAGLLSMYGLYRPTSRNAVMPIVINTVKNLLAARSYDNFTETERLTLRLIVTFIKKYQ